MCDPVTIAIGGLVGGSLIQSERARREQRKATRAQQRIQERRNQRQRLQQIRESQINVAQIEQAGATQGVGTSSSLQGGVAAIQTGTAANVSFINQVESLQQRIQNNLERANRFSGQAQAAASLATLATQVPTGGTGQN